jgi:2-methylcitrate synthase/citrate synthase II
MVDESDIKRGLDGVVVDESAVSKVMPEINALTYRGYPVQELAENCRFEEVAYLIADGELPTAAQLSDFEGEERENRAISEDLLAVISRYPPTCHPMDTTRTSVSFLGLEDPETADNGPEAGRRKAMRLLASIPTVVAADFRRRKGHAPIPPDPSLGFAANFFHMCFGDVPDADVVKAFDVSLTLYAEHGFNASTFTARVVTSTLADMHGAVTAAIASLKGPLHGGANEAVMHMLKEIGEPERAKQWVLDALATKRLIMGFGHRVYRSGDSRVPTMKKYFLKVAERKGETALPAISQIVEDTMIAEKDIYPNLDFPAGPAYHLMGFDIDFFTPIFVISRITGWCAHILEQGAANRLIRPLSRYTGPPRRDFKPIGAR